MAPRDIPPGMDWGAALLEAINIARVMLLVFSSRSNASRQIVREVEIAVGQGLAIIPVRIENAKPTGGLGYFLGTPQWLDAITPPFESHLERIADSTKFWLVRSQRLDPLEAKLPSKDDSLLIGYQPPGPAPMARVPGKWRKTHLYVLGGGVLALFLPLTMSGSGTPYFVIGNAKKVPSVSGVKPIHSPTYEANWGRQNNGVSNASTVATVTKNQVGVQQRQQLGAKTTAQRPGGSSMVSSVLDPDVVFWQSIKGSRDAADYRSYLGEFPNGRFAPLARSRIIRYQRVSSREGRLSTLSPSLPIPSVSARPSATKGTPTSNPASTNAAPTQVALSNGIASSEVIEPGINHNFVVIGGSLQKSDAELLAKRFERFGHSPTLIPAGVELNRYSLKFGPYSPAEVTITRADLQRLCHDLTFHLIVNSPIGPLMDQTTANSALEVIQHLGAHPLLVSREINGQTKYQVEIGPFVTQEEAMNAGILLGDHYSKSLNCPWGNCDWQYTWRGSPPKLLCNDPGRPCQPDG